MTSDVRLDQIERHYRRIYSHIDESKLTIGDDFWPDGSELLHDIDGNSDDLFLG